MPTRSRRNRASPSSSSPPRSTPSTSTRPRGRPLDPADDRHQAGLAGAGGTHHAYAGAGFDREIDAAQDRHRPRGARKGKMHVGKLDHRQEQDPRRRATAPGVQRWRWSSAAGAARLGRCWPACSPWLRCRRTAWACRLSVLGDSLAAGYGVAEADAFPVRLEQALRERGVACTVLERRRFRRHLGRRRSPGWIGCWPTSRRTSWSSWAATMRCADCRLISCGTISTKLLQLRRPRGVEVMLAGMLAPPNLGRSYGDAFRQVYRDVATAHDVPLYPFFLDGAVLADGLMQPDGIHPNARGVQVIVDRIAPLVARAIQARLKSCSKYTGRRCFACSSAIDAVTAAPMRLARRATDEPPGVGLMRGTYPQYVEKNGIIAGLWASLWTARNRSSRIARRALMLVAAKGPHDVVGLADDVRISFANGEGQQGAFASGQRDGGG